MNCLFMVAKIDGRSWVQFWASPSDDWKTQQKMSTFFESGKDKAAKGEGFAPLFICCAQGTVGWLLVVLLFYVHGKHLRSCRDGQLT